MTNIVSSGTREGAGFGRHLDFVYPGYTIGMPLPQSSLLHRGNAKLTHPEFAGDISKPVLVLCPVAVEVDASVHATLKHLNT